MLSSIPRYLTPMRYQFGTNLVLRMPAGDPRNYVKDLQYFLEDDQFLTALYVATPVFFESLKKQNFRASMLTEKEKNTLRKYINRYCFRPTPFGLFASVSLIEWSTLIAIQSASPEYKWHCVPDMSFINVFTDSIIGAETRTGLTYQSNPSIYRVMNEYRFYRTVVDPSGKQRDFQLQAIAFSKLLKDLIAFCETGRSGKEIHMHIAEAASCPLAEAADYTDFLIDAQLLTCCERIRITGKDRLNQLALYSSSLDVRSALKSVLIKLAKLPPVDIRQNIADIAEVQTEMARLLREQNSEQTRQLSIILQRLAEGEILNGQNQQHIQDGIEALDLLSPEEQLPAMSKFVSSFHQHFEGQSVPLLLALDPEAGIGYQRPVAAKNNPLLETLNIPVKNKPKTGVEWSEAHAVLMEAWLSDRSEMPTIKLDPTDLGRLRGIKNKRQMIGMSVLFRVSGDLVFIENAGGINAPALLGRFSVADETIHRAAVCMARHLEQQNPEVIFAELLHLAEPHTDNVNRRESIYHYEIPITAVSALPAEQQLQLSDLYVSVTNDQVVLFSNKHQKIVVPRLTSAYNHSLNKLPLFRFLADLPYQYGRHSLGLELRHFFPGLKFYPRVEYRKTILSLATWVLHDEQLTAIKTPDPHAMVAAFRQLAGEIRLSRNFSFAEGDQELVFDSAGERDVLFFFNCIRHKKEVILKELFPQQPVRQYNCYLLPEAPLLLPEPTVPDPGNTSKQRKYIPGSEWLYLKIYAPKIGADRLLLRLRPLLNKRYSCGKISQWFFIRYEDHAPHIRLRLKVVPKDISEILMAFKGKLENRIRQHVIREYQVDIYSRELERYAAAGIDNSERFFWASSELVLCFLVQSRKQQTVGTYAFALYTTHMIINEFIRDAAEQIEFTIGSFRQFLPEFTDQPFKVDLDKKYRELTPNIMAAFAAQDPGLLSGSAPAGKKFIKYLRAAREQVAQNKSIPYLRSIIHMHLNRIFADEPRKQEMVTYYLLHKYLLHVQGRNKNK